MPTGTAILRGGVHVTLRHFIPPLLLPGCPYLCCAASAASERLIFIVTTLDEARHTVAVVRRQCRDVDAHDTSRRTLGFSPALTSFLSGDHVSREPIVADAAIIARQIFKLVESVEMGDWNVRNRPWVSKSQIDCDPATPFLVQSVATASRRRSRIPGKSEIRVRRPERRLELDPTHGCLRPRNHMPTTLRSVDTPCSCTPSPPPECVAAAR